MSEEVKNALPIGYTLENCSITAILGCGGFGITYRARHQRLDTDVAIKEYLPQDMAVRDGQTTVAPKSTRDSELYEWGLKRFLDEARTLARYQQWAKRHTYVLKLDVRQYFASIDHDILYAQLCRHIKDPRVLALLKQIISNSPPGETACIYFPGDDLLTPLQHRTGIPIGNLTSQFFANLYLNDLDHWLKERQQVHAYLRYVDDLFLLSDSKSRLWELKQEIAEALALLRLSLHTRKAQIARTRGKVDVLGYLIAPDKRWLRNANGHRFARKLRDSAGRYATGQLTWDDFNPSVQSWIGHARHGETEGLRKTIFNQTPFRRVPCGEQA